jgi:hypothetical protein
MNIILEKISDWFRGKSSSELPIEQIVEQKTQGETLPIWCATATVKKENIYGEDHIKKVGTKHFRGGAKVYIADAYWGMCESVTVIGHHRSNSRYVKIDLHVKRLENVRLELVYSPKVAELIQINFDKKYVESEGYTKEYAEKIVEAIPTWIEMYYKKEEE